MVGMANPIVVIGMQRSGNTVFRELLTANGVDDYGEIFHIRLLNNPKNFFYYIYNRAKIDPICLHPERYPELLQTYITESILSAQVEHAVIDLKYGDLRYITSAIPKIVPVTINIFAEQRASFLHIIRRNKLRSFVSLLIGRKTGRWREIISNYIPTQKKQLLVPPQEALEAVKTHKEWEEKVGEWLKDHRSETIAYEEMFEKDDSFSEKSLAVASALLKKVVTKESEEKVTLKKQNAEPLAELVLNFEELAAVFRGTPYAWMLDE